MRFEPKTEEQMEKEHAEAASRYLWPAGSIVDYEIKAATEKTSKAGKPMIELDVDVYNGSGDVLSLKDWLPASIPFKLKRICEANNMLDMYNAGHVPDYELVGKIGKAKLKVQKGSPKNDGSGDSYPDRNQIDEYLKPAAPIGNAADAELNDEIPF